MALCKYSDMFGTPGAGVHQYRIMNIAIVDVVLVFIAAWIFWRIYNKINYWVYVILLFIMGIILHRIFCVRTTVDKLLFPND